MKTLQKLAFLAAALALSAVAHAENIFTTTGPQPFGFANQLAMVTGWSHTSGYQNVSIVMPLADLTNGGPIAGTEGTVYLMNQVGPGTTVANQVAPPVTVSGLTATFTDRTLYSGLTLPPGNYYLVLVSTSANSLSMSPQGSSTPTRTFGAGVTALNGDSQITVAAYPPATAFILTGPETGPANLFVTVAGTRVQQAAVTTVPTLDAGALAMLISGLGAAALLLLRRRRP